MATPRKTTPRKSGSSRKKEAKAVDLENRILDLDAIAAAEAEKNGDKPAPKIRLRGKLYELPRILPAEFMFNLGALQRGDMTNLEPMVDAVFGKAAKDVRAKMDSNDIGAIMARLPELYDADPGESEGSSPS